MLLPILLSIIVLLLSPTYAHKYKEIVDIAVKAEETDLYNKAWDDRMNDSHYKLGLFLMISSSIGELVRNAENSPRDSDEYQAVLEYWQRIRKSGTSGVPRIGTTLDLRDAILYGREFNATSMLMKECMEIFSWPSYHNKILQNQLRGNVLASKLLDMESLTLEFKEDHQIVVNRTLPLLNNIGLPAHTYKILIVKVPKHSHRRKSREHFEHHFEGDKKICSFEKIVYFDTVISRTPVGAKNGSLQLSQLVSQLKAEIENSDTSDLSQIAASLKTKNLLKEFPCLSIVRERSLVPWDPCPKIEYFLSPSDGIFTFNFTKKGYFWQKCEEIRFFFFSNV